MKKLYSTLALACTVALGASAISPAQLAKASRNLEFAENLTIEAPAKVATPSKAPAKVAIADLEEICGIYKWKAYCVSTQYAGETEAYAAITYVMGDIVTVAGYYGNFEATVDEDAGTMTIQPNQVLSLYTHEDGNQYNVLLTFNQLHADSDPTVFDQPLVGTWNGTSFVFPDDIFMLPSIPGLGSFPAYAWASSVLTPYKDQTEWKTIGTAEFVDGWVSPLYINNINNNNESGEVFTPNDFACENVTLQVDPANPNRYSLLNPYKESFLTTLNVAGEGEEPYYLNADTKAEGRIIFDASDPEFVIVEVATYCGYTMVEEDDMGLPVYEEFYPFNEEGMMVYQYGYTPAEAKALFKQAGDATSTFVDNVVTLKNLYFGIGAEVVAPYSWSTPEVKAMMTTTIKMTTNGVEDALISNENAPVEYYNLQGVRVANPENGLYIRRQGNTATKVLVK